MRIIVGLGNPGEKYKLTRHNAGFMAVDALAKKFELQWEKNKKFNALIAPLNPPAGGGDEENFLLVKPQTFMNNSGQAVFAILKYFPKKNNLSEILTVIHDDMDIDLGKYKISTDSRSAGHNGVQSIINALGTKNFRRIRIGVKTAAEKKIISEKFVLQKFKKEELKITDETIKKIVEQTK